VIHTSEDRQWDTDEEEEEDEDIHDPEPRWDSGGITAAVLWRCLQSHIIRLTVWRKATLAVCIRWPIQLNILELLVWHIMGCWRVGWFPWALLIRHLQNVSLDCSTRMMLIVPLASRYPTFEYPIRTCRPDFVVLSRVLVVNNVLALVGGSLEASR
jgi:hypothetical protein